MAPEQEFTVEVKYPVLGKGEWQHTLLRDKYDKNNLVEYFSKIYKCFLIKVKLTKLEEECIIESSIKTPEGLEKYNNRAIFNDECNYACACDFTFYKELPNTERAIDEILTPIKAPTRMMLN